VWRRASRFRLQIGMIPRCEQSFGTPEAFSFTGAADEAPTERSAKFRIAVRRREPDRVWFFRGAVGAQAAEQESRGAQAAPRPGPEMAPWGV
jgi:hypothetical protein